MFNTATVAKTPDILAFAGSNSVEILEKDDISLFYWGDIQNSTEIIQLLATETDQELVDISSTELLLYAYKHWGMGAINHIHGACAFVLYDNTKDLLFMARDKLGLSQIYYTFIEGTCHFADNLLAVTNKIDNPHIQENLIQYYLSTGFTPPPQTLIAGIQKVPTATWIQVKNEEIKEHTYWYPVNNSYLIQESDIPSFKSALQAVENKLGSINKESLAITPKLFFSKLSNTLISAPIGDLTDFITPNNNIFITKLPHQFWQNNLTYVPRFIQKIIYKIANPKLKSVLDRNLTGKPLLSPATIEEGEISKLIAPIIKEKQVIVAESLDTLYEDFKHQVPQKQTASNWLRTVHLALITPEKTSIFAKNNQITSDLIELIIGLPEKIALKIPKHTKSLQNNNNQPLEAWFFERYKQQSYDLLISFCQETEVLDIEAVKNAWQQQDLQLNWRLTSLALWWQQSIKKETTFLSILNS